MLKRLLEYHTITYTLVDSVVVGDPTGADTAVRRSTILECTVVPAYLTGWM